MSQVNILVVSVTDNHLIVKSKDGVTPLFEDALSAAAFKLYLEENEGLQVSLESATAMQIKSTGKDANHSISHVFNQLPASVCSPSPHGYLDGSYTERQLYMCMNMHYISDRWVSEYL